MDYEEEFYNEYLKAFAKKEFSELSEAQKFSIRKIPAFTLFVIKKEEGLQKMVNDISKVNK